MIISKIRGGIGNQLFQWSTGFALAKKHNTDLLLDVSVYQRNKLRQFELEKLGILVELANPEQIQKTQDSCFYKQPFFHFDPLFTELGGNTFIRGYFCSEKYFLDSANEIKSVIEGALSRITLNDDQLDLLGQIENSQSVSLHVRRGDYEANKEYNDFFGTCPISYYEDAIMIAREKHGPDLIFFVFSDDLDWARNHIKLDFETRYADANKGADSYLDLLFMARCKHNIIANSTFSWWAAWMNSHKNKTVIAPSKWFKQNYREKTGKGVWIKSPHYNFADIFPFTWTSI